MSGIVIGLNSTEGKNRLRFETLSERLQKVNIDILHQVRKPVSLLATTAAPDTGELGCFFQDELEQCRKLDTSRDFRRFYWEVGSLVQSLPELLHHLDQVVALLVRNIRCVSVQDLPSYLTLSSVLARDLKGDLGPHFHALVGALIAVVNRAAYSSNTITSSVKSAVAVARAEAEALVRTGGAPLKFKDDSQEVIKTGSVNPELAGQIFECLSHLLRSQWDALSADPDPLRQYYGPLLGNATSFVRDFAARAFVLVVRKLGGRAFKGHLKKVLHALASNCRASLTPSKRGGGGDVAGRELSQMLLCEPLERDVDSEGQEQDQVQSQGQSQEASYRSKRVRELSEGVGLLLFYTVRGVKGRLHSRAGERVKILGEHILPLSPALAGGASRPDSKGDKKAKKAKVDSGAAGAWAEGGTTFASLSEELQAGLRTQYAHADAVWRVHAAGRTLSFTIQRLFRHVLPSAMGGAAGMWALVLELVRELIRRTQLLRGLWGPLIPAEDRELAQGVQACSEVAMSVAVEVVFFAIAHSQGRALSSRGVREEVTLPLAVCTLDLCALVLVPVQEVGEEGRQVAGPEALRRRAALLFCRLWERFPHHPLLEGRVGALLGGMLQERGGMGGSIPTISEAPLVTLLARELLPVLPAAVAQRHLLQTLLSALVQLADLKTAGAKCEAQGAEAEAEGLQGAEAEGSWLGTLLEVLQRIHDPREDFNAFADQCAASGGVGAGGAGAGGEGTGQGQGQNAVQFAPLKGPGVEEDADSWDGSGDEGSSGSDSNAASDSDHSDSESDGEGEGEDRSGSYVAGALALTALQSSAALSHLARACLQITTRFVRQSAAKSKKSNSGGTEPAGEALGEPVGTVAAALALKCLLWFATCTPEVVMGADEAKERGGLALLCADVVDDLLSQQGDGTPGTPGLGLGQGLPPTAYADLLYLSGLELAHRCVRGRAGVVGAESAERARLFLRAVVLHLLPEGVGGQGGLWGQSVGMTWAAQALLALLAPHVIAKQTQGQKKGKKNRSEDAQEKAQGVQYVLELVLSAQEQGTVLGATGAALTTPSYWLRVHWLRVMAHLPPAHLNPDGAGGQGPVCDIARICLEAVCLSPTIKLEREYARRIGHLEVAVRGGRLPQQYVTLVCGFCLGLLHIKFKPIWEPALGVLVTAAKSSQGEADIWPMLLDAVEATTRVTTRLEPKAGDAAEEEEEEGALGVLAVVAMLHALDGGLAVPVTCATSQAFYYRFHMVSSNHIAVRGNFGRKNEAVQVQVRAEAQEQKGGRFGSQYRNTSQVVLVAPDARTDTETVVGLVWEVLKRSPQITLKRSRVVVTLFLNFLQQQYYQVFREDPEIPFLIRLGVIAAPEGSGYIGSDGGSGLLPPRVLKRRLELFLQVFSAVTAPRQLFQHALLYAYYLEILAKADVSAVKLAFDCILTFKPVAIMPYKDSIRRLLDDKTLRDELVNLDPSPMVDVGMAVTGSESSAMTIKPEHRDELIPLLVRTVYGRFTSKARGSKAARDQNIARRAAVLAFVSKMEDAESRHLLQLMFRGVVPMKKQLEALEKAPAAASVTLASGAVTSISASGSASVSAADLLVWYDAMDALILSLQPEDIAAVAWERQIGFLHLLEPLVRVLGFSVTKYVPVLVRVVVAMLTHAQQCRERAAAALGQREGQGKEEGDGDLEEEDEGEDGAVAVKAVGEQRLRRDSVQALRVRSLCLLRVAEMVDQYHAVFDFAAEADALLRPLHTLVLALPSAISSARAHCPAMLRILHSMSQYPATLLVLAPASAPASAKGAVALAPLSGKKKSKSPAPAPTLALGTVDRTEIVRTVIKCIASPGAHADVMRYVVDILHALLDLREGEALYPHSELVIRAFSHRFLGSGTFVDNVSVAQGLKLSDVQVLPSSSIKTELRLLCRIAGGVFQHSSVQISPQLVTDLATLLLGMLRAYTTSRKIRVEQEWVIDILQIYQSLLWRMPCALGHVAFVARLFGPASHSFSLFNTSPVRRSLLQVLEAMAGHASTAGLLWPCVRALGELVAEDKSLLGGRDFARCMPVFQALSGEQGGEGEAGEGVSWSALLGPGLAELQRVVEAETVQETKGKKKTGKKGRADALIPTSTSSGVEGTTGSVAGTGPRSAALYAAVVYEALRCMHDAEMVVRTAALAALRCLISELACWSSVTKTVLVGGGDGDGGEEEGGEVDYPTDAAWLEVLKSILVPAIRRGFKQSNDTVKKGFISLFAHMVRTLHLSPGIAGVPFCSFSASTPTPTHTPTSNSTPTAVELLREEGFHMDCAGLLHEDPEQDFFENITHIQAHRRVRAMQRLMGVLRTAAEKPVGAGDGDGAKDVEGAEGTTEEYPSPFTPSTLNHVLLPIAYHYLFGEEFGKKDHLPLMQGAAAFAGALALHLRWNHFLNCIKTLLRQLHRGKPEKEKVLLTALCAVLDAFHFNIRGSGVAMLTALPSREGLAVHRDKAEVEEMVQQAQADGGVRIAAGGDDGLRRPDEEGNGDSDGEKEVEEVEEEEEMEVEQRSRGRKSTAQTASTTAPLVPAPDAPTPTPDAPAETYVLIAQTLVNNILPWVQVFLLKETLDHKNNKAKEVQPLVALALVKLIKRLEEPVVTSQYKKDLFTNLVIRVTSTLKSRDTGTRDVARDCLAKMVLSLGLQSLDGVIVELQFALKEGFQRHVCNYTVRSVVRAVTLDYTPDVDAPSVPLHALERLANLEDVPAPAPAPTPAPAVPAHGQGGKGQWKEKGQGQAQRRNKEGSALSAAVLLAEAVGADCPVLPAFDSAIPRIMQCVLDDMNGGAAEDRQSQEGGALRKLIREAKGSKANDTLELTAKCLLFRPTYALLSAAQPAALSSVHALTAPLLEALTSQREAERGAGGSAHGGGADLLGKVAEGLQRVALGLSRNPSLQAKELLLYLHSTLQPFVAAVTRDLYRHREAMGRLGVPGGAPDVLSGSKRKGKEGKGKEGKGNEEVEADEWRDLEALDQALPSYLQEESSDEDERALHSKKRRSEGDVAGFKASTWLPSERRSLLEQRAVVMARNQEARARITVLDGASAPRLTGRNKYTAGGLGRNTGGGLNSSGGTGGDRSTLAAIRYCLTLFHACLRHDRLDSADPEVRAMAQPFIPLLGKCLQLPAAAPVVALAIRCLTTLVGWGITVEAGFLTALGNRLLKLMFGGGGLVSTQTELAQACTKGLAALFKVHNEKTAEWENLREKHRSKTAGAGAGVGSGKKGRKGKEELTDAEAQSLPPKPVLPIGADNLRSLVQLLTASIMEVASSFQTAAFQLVREIVATRVLIPEIYDLVTKLGEQIVLSQRSGVREAATSIVVTFLLSYPLGEKRVSGQLTQLVNNCNFEFEEGRASALRALVVLVKALPPPVLQDYANMFFLPATLRVVNDKAAGCREQAAAVVVALVRRVAPDTVGQFQEYAMRWLTAALHGPETEGGSLSSSGASALAGGGDLLSDPAVGARLLSAQAKALVRTGAQVAGLVVKGRPDLCRRDALVPRLVECLRTYLTQLLRITGTGAGAGAGDEGRTGGLAARDVTATHYEREGAGPLAAAEGAAGRAAECWVLVYQLVSLAEMLFLHLPAATDRAASRAGAGGAVAWMLLELLQETALYPHAWVRAASVRVLLLYVRRREQLYLHSSAPLPSPAKGSGVGAGIGVSGVSADDEGEVVGEGEGVDVLSAPNGLYRLARRLCVLLNQGRCGAQLLESVAACTVFAVRAMHARPELTQVGGKSKGKDRGGEDEGEDEEDEEEEGDEDNEGEEGEEEEDDDVNAGLQLPADLEGEGAEEKANAALQKALALADSDAAADLQIKEAEEEDSDKESEDESEEGEKEEEEGEKEGAEEDVGAARRRVSFRLPASGTPAKAQVGNAEAGEASEQLGRGGANWVMQRLRGIAADSRGNRRLHVLKVLLALVQAESSAFTSQYLDTIVEVAVRATIAVNTTPDDPLSPVLLGQQQAAELLQVLEASVGSSRFIGAYSAVQRRVQGSKSEKKRRLAAEAVTAPHLHAARKIAHTERKRDGKKRKYSLKHAAIRGLARHSSQQTQQPISEPGARGRKIRRQV